MNKYLFIGDVHAEPSSLKDADKLLKYVAEIAKKEDILNIVFLGDQTHTHSVLHLSVMSFWKRHFQNLLSLNKIVTVLVGNHDKPGTKGSTESSMMFFKSMGINVVEDIYDSGNLTFVSYETDKEKLLKLANSSVNNGTLVCHQSFVGARFENGFYDPHGIDPALFNYKHIISGHIHAPQKFGNVWYIGSPRWRTVSDANIDRSIVCVEFDEYGNILESKSFSTNHICSPIYLVKDTPETPFTAPAEWADQDCKVTVDISGPLDWVTTRKSYFEALDYRVRTFPEKQYINNVKESEGLNKALAGFIDGFVPKHGTDKDILRGLVASRIEWMKNV